MTVAKEQKRQIISENISMADVYSLLREGFKDILLELMEAKLNASLGYEKIRRADCRQTTSAMDIPKNLKKPVWTFL